MSEQRDVIFVQSRIRSTDVLKPEIFGQWYDDVHMPDLLETPGISASFRYVTAGSDSEADQASEAFPYLAVYPQVDRGWLRSDGCEFLKVPVHADMLPNESKYIFEVADFAMGAYERVGDVVEIGALEGEAVCS